MEQVLIEEKMVSRVRKSSKRKGPRRRRNFVQENIAFLKQLQDTLREKKSETTTVVRARRKARNHKSSQSSKVGASYTAHKQSARTGKHSARKGKSSRKFQPYETNDNTGNLDIKLTKQEKLLLRGYDALMSSSNTDLLSDLSSTDNESDTDEAADEEYGTGVAKQVHYETSKKSEGNKICTSTDGQVAVKAMRSRKMVASKRQKSATSPSGEDLTVNSLHRTFGATKQPSVKMTAKAMAARKKVLAPLSPDPTKAPPSYKRGVVPRYLQTQKKEQKGDYEESSDPQQGYIPLPEDTRIEVLTLLRKSFADFAHQLNMLPLRPPNLEIRERRMYIEKQLDKVEEAIQVFSQSEVSVKVAVHKKSV